MTIQARGEHMKDSGGLPENRGDIAQSIDAIRGALEAMKFGAITLTVHNARVVQLDITEKRRLEP